MFDPPRYATSEIVETLSPEIQSTLWSMVDLLRLRSGVKPDSLQSFKLAPSVYQRDALNQVILHRQEQPHYIATNLMSVDQPVTAKVFVIDDGEHATMMFASEY